MKIIPRPTLALGLPSNPRRWPMATLFLRTFDHWRSHGENHASRQGEANVISRLAGQKNSAAARLAWILVLALMLLPSLAQARTCGEWRTTADGRASVRTCSYAAHETLAEASQEALACDTPTAWVERLGSAWVAVCGDSEGRPVQ